MVFVRFQKEGLLKQWLASGVLAFKTPDPQGLVERDEGTTFIKKPPVLASTTDNWQHKALRSWGLRVATALGILRFQIKGLLKQWLASGVFSCYDTRSPGAGGQGRGTFIKKPPVLASTTDNWQHEALWVGDNELQLHLVF